MTKRMLEQTLIDNARGHQVALAAYYPKGEAWQPHDEAHAEYLKHSGALADLVSLSRKKSGLSPGATAQLREIEDEVRTVTQKRIILSAADSLVAIGCSVTVVDVESGKVFLVGSTDLEEIYNAFCESGESGFRVERVVDGALQKGWVEFVSVLGIEITADDSLQLHHALQAANAFAVQLGAQRPPLICESCGTAYHPENYGRCCTKCGADHHAWSIN
ncbi:hypothetical protein [Pseudomonas reactans]|uniref:hypothetical protein n=1 Tax=Pseudomonas reactans TaxID=117680 RepID=UPI0015A4604A|nr:hypothetical protein [Pseudomonas reactans]NWC90499.1 hypothetical protein [Pseudomonas reactans]